MELKGKNLFHFIRSPFLNFDDEEGKLMLKTLDELRLIFKKSSSICKEEKKKDHKSQTTNYEITVVNAS